MEFSDVQPTILFTKVYSFFVSCSQAATFVLISSFLIDLNIDIYLLHSCLKAVQLDSSLYLHQHHSQFCMIFFCSLSDSENHGLVGLITILLIFLEPVH